MSASKNQKLIDSIDVSTIPQFITDMGLLCADLQKVYDNVPSHLQAKEVATLLVQYDCIPESMY